MHASFLLLLFFLFLLMWLKWKEAHLKIVSSGSVVQIKTCHSNCCTNSNYCSNYCSFFQLHFLIKLLQPSQPLAFPCNGSATCTTTSVSLCQTNGRTSCVHSQKKGEADADSVAVPVVQTDRETEASGKKTPAGRRGRGRGRGRDQARATNYSSSNSSDNSVDSGATPATPPDKWKSWLEKGRSCACSQGRAHSQSHGQGKLRIDY